MNHDNLEDSQEATDNPEEAVFGAEKQVAEEIIHEENVDTEKVEFLRNNIQLINSPRYNPSEDGIRLFASKTNILSYLSIYFYQRLNEADSDLAVDLLSEYEAVNYVKTNEIDIANRHIIYKNDLRKYFNKSILYSLKDDGFTRSDYINHCLEFFKNKISVEEKLKNVKGSLKEIISKQYDFIFTQGYLFNVLNINKGTMTANAGDSAQFLFLARAILLGYNCSNVDVRSSRYDAIIDYNGKLLRVQVKGVTNNTVSFKDRDRGGQGIDHTHERNRGKRITSEECDLYVAVDKQIGACYIIPTRLYIDNLSDDQARGINLAGLQMYKENWSIIDEVIEDLF